MKTLFSILANLATTSILCSLIGFGAASAETIRVATDGSGQYRSISKAVEAATAGAIISIKPGAYTEHIVLTKSLTLEGDGPASSIIIKGQEQEVILTTKAADKIKGLTIVGNGANGIVMHGGRLEISGCDLTSPGHECLQLSGGSSVSIQHCNFHDFAFGINQLEGSSSKVIDSKFTKSIEHALDIKTNGGSARFEKCTISDSGKDCVLIFPNGRVTMVDCDVSGAREFATLSVIGASLTIKHCKIHGGLRQGIYSKTSHLLIFDSEVYDFGWEGLAIYDESLAGVTGTKIRSNHYSGFRINGSTVDIDDCDVLDNTEQGIDARNGILAVNRCRVHRNGYQGLMLFERSRASVRGTDISGNARGAYGVEPDSRLTTNSNVE